MKYKYLSLVALFFFNLNPISEALTLGPNIALETNQDGDVNTEDENLKDQDISVSNNYLTFINLMAPVTDLYGGDIIFLLSYQKDEYDSQKEIAGNIVNEKNAYESLPTGFAWIENTEKNRWIFVYKSWLHPSFKYKQANQFAIGRQIDSSFLKFGSYKQTSAYVFLRTTKFPGNDKYNLAIQGKLENGEGSQINFNMTIKGPSRLTYSLWSQNSYIETGLKVDELFGQLDNNRPTWKTGYQAKIFAAYGRQIAGPVFVNIAAGVKITNREFYDEKTGKQLSRLTQIGQPFIGLALETWL